MANLTTKELTAVSEQLEAESVLIAKYRQYAQTTNDIGLRTQFEAIASKHCQHFDTLYRLLG